MRSRESIIPAVLTDVPNVFNERLKFAVSKRAVHIDILDGDFCQGDISLPIDSWPENVVEYSEAHLMVNQPIQYFEGLSKKRITRAIVHVESHFSLAELRKKAREYDILLGFAVNPQTDLHKLQPFFETSMYIQLMGVQPGRVGQQLLDTTIPAISYLKRLPSYRFTLTVDGGVSKANILALKNAGASYFITTSALFGGGDFNHNYQELARIIDDDQTT